MGSAGGMSLLAYTQNNRPLTYVIYCSICPGRHFSDTALYLSITSILQVFDITLDPNFQGNDIEMTTGLVSCVLSFFIIPENVALTVEAEYLSLSPAFFSHVPEWPNS